MSIWTKTHSCTRAPQVLLWLHCYVNCDLVSTCRLCTLCVGSVIMLLTAHSAGLLLCFLCPVYLSKEPYVCLTTGKGNNKNNDTKPAIGRIVYGMNPFTRFYAAIKTDCHAYGNKFNAALHKVIVDCHNRTTKVKRQCSSKDSVAFPMSVCNREGCFEHEATRIS